MPLHAVPNPASATYAQTKAPQSMSLSHNQFPNHFGTGDIQELFEPSYVKLDKQVRNSLFSSGPQRITHLLAEFRLHFCLLDACG